MREDQELIMKQVLRECELPALTAIKLSSLFPGNPASKLGLQTRTQQLGASKQSQISPSLGFFPRLWDAAPLAGTT